MFIAQLELRNFRNYEQTSVSFEGGLNLIVGSNGQGKTNLLEAVNLLSSLRSPRASTNAALIQWGMDEAIVRATLESGQRTFTMDVKVSAGGTKGRVNGSPLGRDSHTPIASTVLFSPDDLEIIKAGPEKRRAFFDDVAVKLKARAGADRLQFERVLRNRNAALKASRSNPRATTNLEVWTEQLAKSGAELVGHRLEALNLVAPVAAEMYELLASSGPRPVLTYASGWIAAEGSVPDFETLSSVLKSSLDAALPKDMERGISTTGPHRDDVAISLGGADSRMFASQGEQRTLALALKLAELEVVKQVRNDPPILLLDDVFSELDEERKARVAEVGAASEQTIATATHQQGLPWNVKNLIRVSSGRLTLGA